MSGDNGKHEWNDPEAKTPSDRPIIDLAAPAQAMGEDDTAPLTLAEVVCTLASQTIGVRESPEGSNSGPEIDLWLRNAGGKPGESWCASWVYSMFLHASRQLGLANPCPRSTGALRMWVLSDDQFKIAGSVVQRNRELLRPGCVFVEDHGGGHGHVGIVFPGAFTDELYPCISGNTNELGGREGIGVFEQARRFDRLHGVIDFTRLPRVA